MSSLKHSYVIHFMILIIMLGCKKKDENPQEKLNNDLTSGTWKIIQLITDDDNLTPEFEHYRLTFSPEKAPESPQEIFNRLTATDGTNQYQGTWIFMHGNQDEPFKYFLSVAFVNDTIFRPISARWGIDSHTTGNLRLLKQPEASNDDTIIMVLKKE